MTRFNQFSSKELRELQRGLVYSGTIGDFLDHSIGKPLVSEISEVLAKRSKLR